MSPGVASKLGDFAVSGTASEASAFRDATGLPAAHDDAKLPVTFPMRWLVTPDVRAAMVALVPEEDLVLVHESQMFDYESPLSAGEPYTMSLTARRKTDPDQVIVDGTIAAQDGRVLATLETVLRLFSTKAAA